MQRHFEFNVQPDEVDNLGHMNVRTYWTKSALATHALLDQLGLNKSFIGSANGNFVIKNMHTRFHAEQMLGAQLALEGGVVEVQGSKVIVYLDMVNDERDQIAACFRNEVTLVDQVTDAPIPLTHDMLKMATREPVELPERGQPRGLTLAPINDGLTIAELEKNGLEPMGPVVEVLAEDCDPQGFMKVRGSVHIKSGIRGDGEVEFKVPEFRTDDGDRVGIVALESRQTVFKRPRQGDRLVSYRAYISEKSKILRQAHWTMNVETGALHVGLQQVNVPMNLRTRKSIPIPKQLHQHMAESIRPGLAKYASLPKED